MRLAKMMSKARLLSALKGLGIASLLPFIIGFVIFGIGALLRFRSTLDNSTDTVEVILVTVLGLAVGLGLPVMAIMLGMVAWLLIWVSGRHRVCEISLRSSKNDKSTKGVDAVETLIRERDWALVNLHRVPAKNACSIVIKIPGSNSPESVEEAVSNILPDGVEAKFRF